MASQSEAKRRIPDDDAKEHVDHRKRRRNRTTLSCLNCHGSKRMCDRRRPACGRCTKLGLSGTCVYEVDDINRRDQSQDEVLLLKNRIAELEGFIREFKRKPHPRTITRKKREDSPASSAPGSDNGSESDSCPDTGNASVAESPITLSRGDSSSGSDTDPVTPSTQENEPAFLSNHTAMASTLSSPSSSSNQFADLITPSDPTKTGEGCSMDIDSSFDFGGSGLIPGDNDALERVFARLMEQDAQDMFTSNRDCGCVKQSSAYSAILELAPHLRRALNALRSAPEHHARISEFGTPCHYLGQLQSLTDAICSIIESPPAVGGPASSSPLPCAPQSQRPANSSLLSSMTACAEDSPLQRVLAARRAGLASQPHSARSASQTPTIGSSSSSPKVLWKSGTLRSAWGDQSPLDTDVNTPGKDSFMSWEPAQRGPWPGTISL